MSKTEHIWNLMKEGYAMTSKMISANTDIRLGSASSILSQFKKAGLIEVTSTTDNGLFLYKIKNEFQGKDFKEIADKIWSIKREYQHKYYQKTHKEAEKKKMHLEAEMKRHETIKMVKETDQTIHDIELINYLKDAIGEIPRKIPKTKIQECFEKALLQSK